MIGDRSIFCFRNCDGNGIGAVVLSFVCEYGDIIQDGAVDGIIGIAIIGVESIAILVRNNDLHVASIVRRTGIEGSASASEGVGELGSARGGADVLGGAVAVARVIQVGNIRAIGAVVMGTDNTGFLSIGLGSTHSTPTSGFAICISHQAGKVFLVVHGGCGDDIDGGNAVLPCGDCLVRNVILQRRAGDLNDVVQHFHTGELLSQLIGDLAILNRCSAIGRCGSRSNDIAQGQFSVNSFRSILGQLHAGTIDTDDLDAVTTIVIVGKGIDDNTQTVVDNDLVISRQSTGVGQSSVDVVLTNEDQRILGLIAALNGDLIALVFSGSCSQNLLRDIISMRIAGVGINNGKSVSRGTAEVEVGCHKAQAGHIVLDHIVGGACGQEGGNKTGRLAILQGEVTIGVSSGGVDNLTIGVQQLVVGVCHDRVGGTAVGALIESKAKVNVIHNGLLRSGQRLDIIGGRIPGLGGVLGNGDGVLHGQVELDLAVGSAFATLQIEDGQFVRIGSSECGTVLGDQVAEQGLLKSKGAVVIAASLCSQAIGFGVSNGIGCKVDGNVQTVVDTAQVNNQLAIDEDPDVIVAGEGELDRFGAIIGLVHTAVRGHGEGNGGTHTEVIVHFGCCKAGAIIVGSPNGGTAVAIGTAITLGITLVKIQAGIVGRSAAGTLGFILMEVNAVLAGIKGVGAVCIDKGHLHVGVDGLHRGISVEDTAIGLGEDDILVGVQGGLDQTGVHLLAVAIAARILAPPVPVRKSHRRGRTKVICNLIQIERATSIGTVTITAVGCVRAATILV